MAGDDLSSLVVEILMSFKSFKVTSSSVSHQLWELSSLKDGQKIFIKSLGAKGSISICNESSDKIELMVDRTRIMQIEKMLKDRNINFVVSATSSPPPALPLQRTPLPPRIKSKEKAFDWNDYYPLPYIYTFLEQLEVEFPSTCTLCAIGKTAEGRDIKMLRISNSNSKNTGVWLDGTTHAREWISAPVVCFIANYVARNFNSLNPVLTDKDWYFVPVLNPDGYYYSHTGDRMWRKNRAKVGNKVVGVDLNRNFGFNWGRDNTEILSVEPTHNNFRGATPFSEPETCAVKDIILYSGIPFKIFISFHSFSEVIAFPWCFTADPCEDYVSLLEGGTVMAKAINKTTGRIYKVGNFQDVMYSACGTSIDWSYGTARIPFSYLIELRGKNHKFILPKEQILDCSREALNAVLALAKYADKKRCKNCSVILRENYVTPPNDVG